ncbi:MAG: ANTAR domain-containing protein [Rhodospirillaceae bacterium]|nr:ANTAR domain-containing protein [Rhodospirillaceae bacterium]
MSRDPEARLRVLVIDEEPIRASILEEGLLTGGDVVVTRISEMHDLLARVAAIDPQVILIALENPSRDTLEQLLQVSRDGTRPVCLFVDQTDGAQMQAAIDAGVSAYVVDGLKKERVRPIAEMAIHRFNAFARLRRELEDARSQLADRKVIERAKGLLMRSRRIDEEAAYRLLQRTAMKQNKRLAEIAQSLVTAAALLDETDP